MYDILLQDVKSPSNGSARTSAPTVSGARWRLKIPLKVLDPTDTVNFVCSILPGVDVSGTSIHHYFLKLYYYKFEFF